MQDILSQKEIDELLASLSSGDISAERMKEAQAEKKIKNYDFFRPNRFSKEQIRTIEMIHENFARLLSTFLSAQLRTAVEVKLLSVQELSYDEFIRSLCPYRYGPGSTRGTGRGDASGVKPGAGLWHLERLLGGKETSRKRRALTEIEQTIILKLTDGLQYFDGSLAISYHCRLALSV